MALDPVTQSVQSLIQGGFNALSSIHNGNKQAKVQKAIGEMTVQEQSKLADKLQKANTQTERLQLLLSAADSKERQAAFQKNIPLVLGISLIGVVLIITVVVVAKK